MSFGCDETQRYIDAWIDGELDPGAALRVETHVYACGDCRAEVDTIKSLKRALSNLRESTATPHNLRSKISAMLDAEDQADREVVQTTQRKKHAMSFALAGAALAGVVVSSRGFFQTTNEAATAEMVPPVLEDIAQRYARDLPAEVHANQPDQVANFFRGRLDIPVRPVAFRGLQAQLIGGRITNVRDRMAATLYYDVAGRRVSVFVFDSALMPRRGQALVRRTLNNNRDVYIANVHGYTVAFSEQGGVAYAVASDLPPQDALRVVERAEIQ